MKNFISRKTTLFALLPTLAIACTEPAGAEKRFIGDDEGELRAAIVVDADADVAQIRYAVTACDDPSDSMTIDAPLVDQLSADDFSELGELQAGEGADHRFAGLFEVLEAGCYNVEATPLGNDGEPSADCASATKENIEVGEGESVEVALIMQCDAESPGGVDILALAQPRAGIGGYKL